MRATALAKTDGLSREGWLRVRRQGIGSSEAAAVAGLSPWRSPLEVYLDKVGELADSFQESEPLLWGNLLEPVVAREFSRRTGIRLCRRRAVLQSPEHPFALANLDYQVRDARRALGCAVHLSSKSKGFKRMSGTQALRDESNLAVSADALV